MIHIIQLVVLLSNKLVLFHYGLLQSRLMADVYFLSCKKIKSILGKMGISILG